MKTPSPADIENLLRGLSPQPLEISRDDLFFRAGYAAGNRGQRARLFWPSAAAAMLVACMGLGVAVERQTAALHTALAAQNPLPQGEGRVRVPDLFAEQRDSDPRSEKDRVKAPESIAQHPHPNPLPEGEGIGLYDDRLRSWQQIANANFNHPGRLTARGWIELPDDFHQPTQDATDESTVTPRPRPSTYLELRQLHLEG